MSGKSRQLGNHRSRAHIRVMAAAILGVGALGSVALTAPLASAQIPGFDPRSQIVVADNSQITVTIPTRASGSGAVSGTVQNNLGTSLTCQGMTPDDGLGGTVTEALIVKRGLEHYLKYPKMPDPTVIVGAPVVGDINIPLGSVTTMLPGSVSKLIWPEAGDRGEIKSMYDQARILGHVGTTGTFSLGARANQPFSVTLGQPAVSPRTDFQAGAFFMCRDSSGQYYVAGGYEGGTNPVATSGGISTGSLRSGS